MNRITHAPLPGTTIDPLYPDFDGRYMGDTDFHNVAMMQIREALEDFYADQQNIYVASNLVMYYQEGEPTAHKDPDVLIAKGVVGKHKRRSFRVWEEKVIPQVLFEIASKSTWRGDIDEKRRLYAKLGVKEYFLFDPEARYLKPVLQGFKSVKGEPVPLKPRTDGSLVSKELGMILVAQGDFLRLLDSATDERVLTRSERAEQEKERAEQEKERADRLEAEVVKMKARLRNHES